MSKPHVHAGYPCLHCDQTEAAPDSFFCSPKCSKEFMKTITGPVRCYGRHASGIGPCRSEAETVAEAQAAGWLSVEPDPEGLSWNYSGLCPVCCPLTGTRIAQAP